MGSSGMLHRVALVRTDVPEELGAFVMRVTTIGEIGTMLAITSNRHMPHMKNLQVPVCVVLTNRYLLWEMLHFLAARLFCT
jgi:hypothetical protein